MATNGTLVSSSGSNQITGSWRIVSTDYVNNTYTVNVTANTSGPSSTSPQHMIELYSGTTSYVGTQGGYGFSLNTNITIPSGITFVFRVGVIATRPDLQVAEYTVPVIDRGSTVTLSTSSVELGGSITINISRKSSSFTHIITGGFSTSALTDTLASNVGTSASVSFPIDIFASRITDSASKTYIIRTTTYSGSSAVGYADRTITLIVPETYVDPQTGSTVTIAPHLWNPTVTEIGDVLTHFEKYYNNRSKLSMSCDVELSFDSPITSYTLTFNGVTKTGTSLPVDMDNVISVDSSKLPRTYPVTLTAVDGRGRSATISKNIYVQNYSLNVSGVDIYRSDASGNRDSEGTYIAVTGAYTKTSIKDGSGNEQNFVRKLIYVDDQLVLEDGNVRKTDAYNGMVILPTTGEGIYNINTVYNVRVGYGDAVTSYVVKGEATIPTALRPISINADGSAIAFGKPALNSDKGMYIYYDPVYIYGKLVTSHIGQIIMSTTLKREEDVIAEYGGERWVQHDGYMLRGASSGVTASTENDLHNTADGGEANHTLTINEMPSHTHVQDSHNHTQNSHGHTMTNKYTSGQLASGSNSPRFRTDGTTHTTNFTSCGETTATNNPATATNQNTGGGQPHNNMPPYKNVYIWERIK